MDQFRLDGKVALVTGGTGALGAALCHTLADAGATVIVMARRAEPIAIVVNAIRAAGGRAAGLTGDVLDEDDLKQIREQIQTQFGKLDILVNGTGGNRPEATAMPGQRTFFDLPQDALKWVFDLNLLGTILPSQIFGSMMSGGTIINISSMAAFQPLTRVVAYSAAKAAINNFTQWLAITLAAEQIRVNAIAPGFFLGDQNRFLLTNEDGTLTTRGQQIIDHTPMQRFGEPEDLSGALLWLASDASRFVTGIVVPVDGGFNAYSGV